MEHLRPFFTLCQACGMIPYSITYNFKTNIKAVHFSFSFKNFVTWWFSFVFILQLGFPLIMNFFSKKFLVNISPDGKAPATITILGMLTILCYVFQLLVTRWIVLRNYKRFQHVISAAYEIERLLKVDDHHQGENIKKRFYIALILIAVSVNTTFHDFLSFEP